MGCLAGSLACAKHPAAHEPAAAGVRERSESGTLAKASASAPPNSVAAIEKAVFGTIEGKGVELFTLTNRNGMVVKVMTYGAIVTELRAPDRTGKFADVVLGFDQLDGYVNGNPYFGAIVGRVANRIRNARFKLGDQECKLAANEGAHHLHGGNKGWDKVIWSAEPIQTSNGASIKLTYVSHDGEEGYPGTVTATALYTLTHDNEFQVELEATTDKPTIVNMVHHSYWNLAGQGSGSILDHELTLFADRYTPGDPVIPTGRVLPVKGTPFDFTSSKRIGKDLRAGGDPIGFDQNFVVTGDPHALRPVARLKDPLSGRVLTLTANQPGVQFYTGNFLDGKTRGKGGRAYAQYSGLCLESQKFPNSIDVPEWRDEVVLNPGQHYHHVMIHRFSVE